MSRKQTESAKKATKQSRFVIFVKPQDENGITIDRSCGWLCLSPELKIVNKMKEAHVFTEKESGHGSSEDWKNFFSEEFPNWDLSIKKIK